MTAKILQDVLQRVEEWPEVAQVELAEVALEIEASLRSGVYYAAPKELEGIDRGMEAARGDRFATDDQIRQVFRKIRPA